MEMQPNKFHSHISRHLILRPEPSNSNGKIARGLLSPLFCEIFVFIFDTKLMLNAAEQKEAFYG